MKYFEVFGYFESRYGNTLAQQILDEMPPSGLRDLMNPNEIIDFYQKNLNGAWVAYRTCRRIQKNETGRMSITGRVQRVKRALSYCREAKALQLAAGA